MIKFAYTILYVRDVARSLAFYQKAFGLKKKFMTEDKSYGELLSGETTLSFASVKLARANLKKGFQQSSPRGKAFGIEIGFTTDNVEKTMKAAVKAGAKVAEKPKQKPWGQTVGYLRDPDGFLLEVCTPMA